MLRWIATHQRAATAFALAGLVGWLAVRLIESGSRPGADFAHTSYDSYYLWFNAASGLPADPPVVIVYLDLDSYLSQGLDPKKPLPRDQHARLLDRLTAAGARAVLFDIVFDVPGADRAADEAFAAAIRRNGRTVLAAELDVSGTEPGPAGGGRTTKLALPAEAFLNAAAGWGLAEVGIDQDFSARRQFPGLLNDDQPSLTWAAGRILHLPSVETPRAVQAARWLRYYGGPITIPHVKYVQALDPLAVGNDVFRDKVVLVGGRPIIGLLLERRDEFRSPFRSWGGHKDDLFMPGVEVHATQMLNLLRGDWLTRTSPRAERAILLLAALFGAGLFWLRPVSATVVAALGAGAGVAGALGAFRQGGVWCPWLIPVAVQIPAALAGSVLFHSVAWYRARRQLEAGRRQAEARIREQAALLDKAHDAILVQDLAGNILYANPGVERLYGWPLQELQDEAVAKLFPADDRVFAETRRVTLERGEWHGELRQQTRAGRPLIVESRWTLIRDDAGQPKSLLVINTDATAQRQLESENLRMQRMETIGALAGGMAHDLNNALAPVLMGAQLLRRTAPNEEARRILTIMESSTHRGAEMVRQVLHFARGHEGDIERLDLRPQVRDMEKLVRDTFTKNITVTAYLPADLWPVRGNPTQLHQVLLNLCVNARDAMPDGGTLSLAADNVELTDAEAREIPGATAGPFVSLLVSDTGTGIPPEVLPKIFEAFFTTKPEGKGTGLGLSTTARIVKAHGGFVSVKSPPGEGATFEIWLPALTAPAPAAPAAPAVTAPRGHDEWILVADDEQAVSEMLRRGLEDHGYRVLTASNGAEAVSLFKERADDIALVITDLSMPVMDGAKALAAMRELRPGLRSLLMSGEGNPAPGGDPTIPPGMVCLPKPFHLGKLLEAVADALAPAHNP